MGRVSLLFRYLSFLPDHFGFCGKQEIRLGNYHALTWRHELRTCIFTGDGMASYEGTCSSFSDTGFAT